MKSRIILLLAWVSAGLLFSNFTACESDSDGGGKNGLVGRYWAQHEYQMEQLIENVDNAEPFDKLFDEKYGSANYNSTGYIYYFANENTVHVIFYQGVKMRYSPIVEGNNKNLLFTLSYGDDIVFYYGDIDKASICSYEVLDGKLYIYSNSDFDQFNLVDGGFVSNGGHILYQQLELGSEFVKENPKMKITEGQKIDLGLSVKWAGWNIGAKSPEQYGGYYAWGEIVERTNYSDDYYNCDWSKLSKMNIGGTEYDVATTKWGSDWRLPSKENFDELVDKCEWTIIRYKDTYGARVEGPNGNSIFLPIPGTKIKSKLYDERYYSMYWTDSPQELSLSTGSLKCANILTLELLDASDGYYGDGIGFLATTCYYGIAYNGGSVRAVSDN